MSTPYRLMQKIMTERGYQFWALNLFGWTGYGFFVALSAFLWEKDLTFQIFYAGFSTLTGLLLSLVMRESFRKLWLMTPLARGLATLAVVGVVSGLWSYIKMIALMEGMGKAEEINLTEYVGWYTYSFFIVLSWAALYFGIKYYQMLQEERRRTLKATSMAHEAQLKMLRYQLNPHFLFNTLNAISTLILISDTKTANSMVTELSKFLRYSLENDPMQKVDLEQEISALTLYLNIEKVRFEERLRLVFDIEDSARKALIPSLLLQPLVENSIKYAISKSETGGEIGVAAKVFAGELLLEIWDDGPGITLENGDIPSFNGVGLRNFKERLREIYGNRHSCSFSAGLPQGLHVRLRLPYETQSQEKVS